MNTKYLSKEDRKSAKRQARQDYKAILLSLTRKERKDWKRSEKGLREFAEGIGKNTPKAWYKPQPPKAGNPNAAPAEVEAETEAQS